METIIALYKDYIKTHAGNLADPNYDCAEIADDLVELFGRGTAVYIVKRSGKFLDLNIRENGKIEKFANHYFVLYGDKVYDPRFSNEPVDLGAYYSDLYSINDNVSEITIELSLTDSNLETDSQGTSPQTQAISSDIFHVD